MDFFERVFGLNLDGGSGVLEALWLLLPIAVIVIVRRRRTRSRRVVVFDDSGSQD